MASCGEGSCIDEWLRAICRVSKVNSASSVNTRWSTLLAIVKPRQVVGLNHRVTSVITIAKDNQTQNRVLPHSLLSRSDGSWIQTEVRAHNIYGSNTPESITIAIIRQSQALWAVHKLLLKVHRASMFLKGSICNSTHLEMQLHQHTKNTCNERIKPANSCCKWSERPWQ